ncbi:uncharacterized protein LACBIDRAFT_310402 [Laccaria bicolor S238N-H82]|uniref:Predicted protein n=1 Tax=Laccaria bicolor (strain S238N-H82 / ATCC MYA-4686) TaxID=486041 RepID=B0DU95_LACBS|nr:uncharacterized protein LACBIDRAFT_310402 [Laccaria bicolor S238N-H82]EDR01909.1 predicted protein [Laccaria bicolor S238N-H82]|eukprot:XP_001887519.1 predicted protein [Laccaria bicolor S238N-H82]
MVVPTQPFNDLELAVSPIKLESDDSDAIYLVDVKPSCSTASWSSKAFSDKLSEIVKGIVPFLVTLLKIVLIVASHLVALVLAETWASLWFAGIRGILGFDKSDTPSTLPPTPPEKSSVQLSWFDSLFAAVAVSVWTVMASIAFIIGIVGCFAIVASMGYFIAPYVRLVVDPIVRKFSQVLRPWYTEQIEPLFAAWRPSYTPLHDQVSVEGELEILGVTEGNSWRSQWLQKVSTLFQEATSPFKSPGPRLQVICDLLFSAFRITLHTIVHAVALFPPFAWSTMWLYGMFKIWQGGLAGPDETGFFMWIFLCVFLLVWSAGALVAIGLGCYGCYVVLSSFVVPVFPGLPESRVFCCNWKS